MVHRAEFLAELAKPVSKHLKRTSKNLVAVSTTDDGSLHLRLDDGTTEPADALIDAGGIHSFVRKHLFGKDHLAVEPVFTGWWDCRNLVPLGKAKQVLGKEYMYFEVDRQYAGISYRSGFRMYLIRVPRLRRTFFNSSEYGNSYSMEPSR